MKLIDKISGEILEGDKKQIEKELVRRVDKYSNYGTTKSRHTYNEDKIPPIIIQNGDTYTIMRAK